MQKVEENELKKMQGGIGHYHWKCRDGFNYISKTQYTSFAAAGKAADKHIDNYPKHVNKVSVIYCEKKH